ncbi:MAG: Ig-like domain-containing protein, partial [Syntrophomonadaceae bacterium]|nr:Ig-like domain-containing protein [Syntrophomonadaceae bacterium]
MFFKRKGWGKGLTIALVFVFLLQCIGMMAPQPASAATTTVTITKYAIDRTTVLDQMVVDYHWLMNPDNIPVMGDGITHYYHQGPVFVDHPDPETQELLRWNVEEDTNWDTKDMGALKGTNVKDLCNLVGDMTEGDTLTLRSTDGFNKTFAYKNVYEYDPDREGPMVLTWYKDGMYPDTGYYDGMRLVWFAGASYKQGPTSIEGLPSGDYHVFGNWEWHEAADPEYWYYYSGTHPTTTGLSVQYVTQVNIYSNEPVPVAVTGVDISQGDQTLDIGDTVQLTAVVTPANATNPNVSWSSSNEAVATVSGTGLVTAVSAGTATITVTTQDGNFTDSTTVTVDEGSGPVMDVLYDGTVSLTPGETFAVTVGAIEYTLDKGTPLGALQAAAEAGNFTYVLSDKRWSYDEVLLLDDVGTYLRKAPGYWYAYVNDVYKDGYQNTPAGLNVIQLADGDRVEFYYAADISDATDLAAVKAAATAAVKTVASIGVPSTMDVLYDGTVSLTPEETFAVTAYNSGTGYTVSETTPLGALQAAANASGFSYDVTDKNYAASGALLVDNIGDYDFVKGGSSWLAYVNNVYKDGFNNAPGALNLIQLIEGDRVEFYYAANISDATDLAAVKAAATAAVKTVVSTGGVVPADWTLQLFGAKNQNVTRAYFEQGLACPSSGHQVTWTDDKGTPDTSDDEVWGGVPLWLLVAMVDDDPDVGDDHINFNDELAAAGYEVKVIAGDGWDTVLDSADIARSDAYIVANTLNGEPLPLKTESNKDSWPLHLK